MVKVEFFFQIIKKFSIESEEDLVKVNQINNIDYLLFDYKPSSDELPGGNSKSFDWNLLKNNTEHNYNDFNVESVQYAFSHLFNTFNIKSWQSTLKGENLTYF